MPDPTTPTLHVRPASGWLNDPNGLACVDGTWHVFFQHQPGEPVHRDVEWGHASSTDLLHWRHHPVALRPRPGGIDQAGCWSGCVVVDHGVPTAVYTAVPGRPEDGVVALARSDRTLETWVQGEAVAGIPADQGRDQGVEQVRDPFVLEYAGRRYAVQGAGSPSGPAQLLAYDCTDLTAWVPLGPLLTIADPVAAEVAPAHIWECPNLVEVDGRWVLVVSRWRWTGEEHDLAGSAWLVGDLQADQDRLTFRPERGGRLDDGPAFYAPQVVSDDGRVLLWGWAWELGRTEDDVRRAGWAGLLTHPRELHVVDGDLHVTPASELEGLRAEDLDPAVPVEAGAFEVVAHGPLTLRLVGGGRDETVWSHTGDQPVRVLVDGSIVEAYAGGSTYTTRAYPSASGHWVVAGEVQHLWAHRLPEARDH